MKATPSRAHLSVLELPPARPSPENDAAIAGRRSFSSLPLETLASTMPLITQGKAFMGCISICSKDTAGDRKMSLKNIMIKE